jgi:peroxiredoxin
MEMVRCMLLSMVVVALNVVVSGLSLADEVEIGAKGPEFKAVGIDGKQYSVDSFKGSKAIVIAFTCNNCPVAVAYEDRFIDFHKKYADKGVTFIAINVNASEDLAAMRQRAEEKGLNYIYAYDESGDSARAYGARVTPHLFVLDAAGAVAYRGSFDDKQAAPTTAHVENAVNALLAGEKPELQSTKAFGCGIKPRRK